MSNPQIPGFHFDHISKRYYKILPNHQKNFINQDTLRKNKELNDMKPLKPKESQNITKIIKRYQNGSINAIIYKKLSLISRAQNFVLANTINFDESSSKNLLMSDEEVPFIISTWESHLLFRIRHTYDDNKEDYSYKITSLIGTSRPSPVITISASLTKAAENEYLVLKLNQSMNNFSNLYFTEFYNLHLNNNEFYTKGTSIISSHSSSTIWSCAVNSNSRKIALGAEKEIRFFGYANNFKQSIKTPGNNNLALSFNDMGDVVYAGTHSGKICIYDLRTKIRPHILPTNRGVLYLKLLNNGHSLIVSCLDDFLAMNDIRMSGVVLKYPNHRTPGADPRPFSIVERENLLCSVQKSGGVRVWSLWNGDILAYLPPREDEISTATCFWDKSHPFPLLLTAPHSGDKLFLYTLRPS